jgi:hypothetical protein
MERLMKIYLILLLSMFISMTALSSDFQVTRSKGEILVNGTKYHDQLKIITGDTIQAIGKKSFIQIKTSSGSVFLVKNGKLVIEKFTKKTTLISLIRGKFFHFYDKTKNRKSFKVKTKTAVMGVRGTKYMIDAQKDQSYLCVCQGVVLAQLKDSDKTHTINTGDDIFLKNGSAHKQRANSQMMSMAKKEFKEMGYPVSL